MRRKGRGKGTPVLFGRRGRRILSPLIPSPPDRLKMGGMPLAVMREDFLITAHIQRIGEGNIFGLWVSSHRGKGYLPWMGEGVPTLDGELLLIYENFEIEPVLITRTMFSLNYVKCKC